MRIGAVGCLRTAYGCSRSIKRRTDARRRPIVLFAAGLPSRARVYFCSVAALFTLVGPRAAPAQTREVPRDSVALRQIVDIVAREYWRVLPGDSIGRALREGGLAVLDPYSELLS